MRSEAWVQVQEQVSRFPGDPYLLTVTAENRPHCGSVAVRCDDARCLLIVPAPSSWPGSAASGYCQVSLVWPPPAPGGHSLIIDGDAHNVPGAGEQMLAIDPTRAVLYRRGPGLADPDASCSSDCIPILSP
ncbi:MAG: pyridoxamine 5'-phosphate oxidase family protein [Jatrophihabitantaceae bacterium]